jgi:hypothetical protein
MADEIVVTEPIVPASFKDFEATIRAASKGGESLYAAAASAYRPAAPTESVEKKEDATETVDKPEGKADAAPVDEEKKTDETPKEKQSRLERKVAKATREYREQIAALSAKVEALSKPTEKVADKAVAPEDVEPVEPQEGDFVTIAEYVRAVRGYDKEHAVWKARQDQVAARATESENTYREGMRAFFANRDQITKDEKYKNYAEVANAYKGPDMSPVLERVTVMTGDASLMYDYCTTKGMVRKLNDISEDAGVAILKSADAPASVLRYLASNPEDITKINELTLAKRAAFIGKIEARVESEAKAAGNSGQRKEETRTSGGNVTGKAPEGEHADMASGRGDKAPKTKASVDPKVTGGSAAPQTNWAASVDMTFAERSRLMKEAAIAKRR